MAKKRKKTNQNLPKWAVSAFAVIAVVLSVITFGGDLLGMETPLAEQCLNFIDRILYGGPTSPAPVLPTTGEAKVYVIDVGQGESILITTEAKSLLIDAGENDKGDEVLEFIENLGLDRIDYAIGTHAHSDHIGGLDTVLDRIEVGEVFFSDIPDKLIPSTKTYSDVLDALDNNDVQLSLAYPGDTIDLGYGAVVTILGPVTKDIEDLNNSSVVCRLDFGETSFLFNGDQEKQMEKLLLDKNANLDCDVMTMGHHGSTTSSSKAYIEAITPEYASISCGRDNKYGHPHDEIVEMLEEERIEYYRTDLSGNITFTTDGKDISVRTEKP